MPASLAIAIVCKDNVRTIGPVLDALRGLTRAGAAGTHPPILAVDSGSTDATLAMLEGAGATVVHSPWLGHVRTKQLALERAGAMGDWVLCLDSDEVVLPVLAASIRRALDVPAGATRHAGYELNRKVFYAGRLLEHAFQPEWRLRLVRAGSAAWTGHDPHDTLVLTGGSTPGRLAGDLRHDSFGSVADHFAKGVGYAKLSGAQIAESGRASVWRLLTSPGGALLKQLVVKRAFLDGWRGVVAASSTAVLATMKHAYALEHARAKKEP
ncbi:MAG: glycosyltransferase family 2 protein [Phycisphaerales bacterium]